MAPPGSSRMGNAHPLSATKVMREGQLAGNLKTPVPTHESGSVTPWKVAVATQPHSLSPRLLSQPGRPLHFILHTPVNLTLHVTQLL